MGKLTISMAIFSSYVSLPEGTLVGLQKWDTPKFVEATWRAINSLAILISKWDPHKNDIKMAGMHGAECQASLG